jgi:hypothetical protein
VAGDQPMPPWNVKPRSLVKHGNLYRYA